MPGIKRLMGLRVAIVEGLQRGAEAMSRGNSSGLRPFLNTAHRVPESKRNRRSYLVYKTLSLHPLMKGVR